MSREHVNLVVTCTARKTVRVPEFLMMRSLRRDRLDRRFSQWNQRLQSQTHGREMAADLYCGNTWSVIREIAADKKLPCNLRIWVISAGHGLVAIDEDLVPYAATFTPHDEDSVIPPELASHSVAEWWDLLVINRRQAGATVASIADIARLHPRTPLVAAISNEYLKAVAHDLEATRAALADDDRLIIIAAGAKKSGPLGANFLPCDSRFEHHYGRSRMALNARILRSLVKNFPAKDIRANHLSSHFAKLLVRLPKAGYPLRRPSEDETVRSFIRREISNNAKGTYTALLRRYRTTGRACEQKRFRGFFREVVGKKNEPEDSNET